jgi:phosphoserine phosphatase RsbU/P
MATLEVAFLHNQLEQRKRRLEEAIAVAPQNAGFASLLREVDSALDRMAKGNYGLCEECHDTVEQDRLLTDPLVRYCLDHLTDSQRNALQRDLDLASEVQRKLLPQPGLRADVWDTSYHYAPVGPVSGDYCDLIPSDGQLFFAVGDVSGKGVAASMLMTQLHALFRSLTCMGLPLGQIVGRANRVFCESALAGQYATLVCGLAKTTGEIEIHNAGPCPPSSLAAVACFVLNPRVCRWACSTKASSPPRACKWKPTMYYSSLPTASPRPAVQTDMPMTNTAWTASCAWSASTPHAHPPN